MTSTRSSPGSTRSIPLYTADYFELLDLGFPLLKRNFLSENSKNVPDLRGWKGRVAQVLPAARLDVMERNLFRVAPDDRLRRSFAIVSESGAVQEQDRPLSQWELVEEDRHTEKLDHWWAFPVDELDHQLAGGCRAVFEAVRMDPSIKKIVLTRSRRIELDGENVVVVPLISAEGQRHLVRAGHVFVHELPGAGSSPVDARLHNVINVAECLGRNTATVETELSSPYRAVVAGSHVAAFAVAEAHRPLRLEDVWVTGNPRTDLVLCASGRTCPAT